MKFKYSLIMSMILLALLSSTVYLAMHSDRKNDACEAVLEKTLYLSLNESAALEGEISLSENEEIIELEEGKITGRKSGTTSFQKDCTLYTVHVSDLYTLPFIDMNKEYLPENRYTYEENIFLDKVLASLINEAGLSSRAGAVEAVRFLTLRFPYKLHYFYENGRLSNETNLADGEGRYYQKGLYLSKEKMRALKDVSSDSGPWGTIVYEKETGEYTPNGLDCSGFITWALLNAGFDCGDIGAGPSEGMDDLSDLGQLVYMDYVNMDRVKCGDLVGMDGHIGMIIGLNNEKVYIGEAYWVNDLQVRIYSYEQFLTQSEWDYVIFMDDYYKNDGNYTTYWE